MKPRMAQPITRDWPSRVAAASRLLVLAALFAFQALVFIGGTSPSIHSAWRPRNDRPLALRAEDVALETAEKKSLKDMTPEEKKAWKEKRKDIVAAYTRHFEAVRRGVQLDGDLLDNLDEYYQETIMGDGGKPQGFMMELVLRSFFGSWDGKDKSYQMSYDYTGDDHQPGPADFEMAWQTLKKSVIEGQNFETEDDGNGWYWLVIRQTWGGLQLYLAASPPFGDRPIALIKKSNPEEFFQKVDWPRLNARMYGHQLWGGAALEFPFQFSRRIVRA